MDMEHWLSVSKIDDSKGPVLISGITGVECIGGFPGISEETDLKKFIQFTILRQQNAY